MLTFLHWPLFIKWVCVPYSCQSSIDVRKKNKFQFTKAWSDDPLYFGKIMKNFTIQHALEWFIMIHVFHIQTKNILWHFEYSLR